METIPPATLMGLPDEILMIVRRAVTGVPDREGYSFGPYADVEVPDLLAPSQTNSKLLAIAEKEMDEANTVCEEPDSLYESMTNSAQLMYDGPL